MSTSLEISSNTENSVEILKNKFDADMLDTPSHFNSIVIQTDKEALYWIDFLRKKINPITFSELQFLNLCELFVLDKIGTDHDFGIEEFLMFQQLVERHLELYKEIIALSDHILASIDFECTEKDVPAEFYLDVGLAIGNLSLPYWEKTFINNKQE